MEKNIICINPKRYNVTKDKEYNVIEEKNDRYIIKNDNGKIVGYSKNLFKIKENKTEITSEILKNIVERAKGILPKLNINDTVISCGIYQIAGVSNNIFTPNIGISLLKKTILKNIPEEKQNDVLYYCILHVLLKALKNANCAKYIASDAERKNNLLHTILDEICIYKSEGVVNPNSGNVIYLWDIEKEYGINELDSMIQEHRKLILK